ncbi:MAG: hypothetical protein ACP5JP_08245 [bacterium]
MKVLNKIIYGVVIGFIGIMALVSLSCNSSTPSSSSGSKVTIKGSFTGGTNAQNNWMRRFFARLTKSAYALDPSQVMKVIVFSNNWSYEIAPVTNNTFSIDVSTGQPVGMIFAGANDNFLGYLTLGNGIDSLPLTRLTDTATIDLQALSSNGKIVEPGHNPIGSEIPLTQAEQSALAQSNSLFASTVINPDVDGNGKIDLLEGKFFKWQILYFINGGTISSTGTNIAATLITPASISGFRLAVGLPLDNAPGTVSFSGPAGSGLSNSTSGQSITNNNQHVYFSSYIQNPPIPAAGQYTITYGNTALNFSMPDQSAAPSKIVVAAPTIILNSDGTINKIKWTYNLGDGSGSIDPRILIGRVLIQIEGSGTPCANYPQGSGWLYQSDSIPPSTTEFTLPCQSVVWSNVSRLYMVVTDIFDNQYIVTFQRQ